MISNTTTLLQQAGAALRTARQALDNDVATNAQAVTNAIVESPFSPETERAVTQLRAFSQLAHELQALDEKMGSLYLELQGTIEQSTVVSAARKARSLPSLGMSRSNTAAAEDIVSREAHTAPKAPTGKLPKNAAKLFAYLQKNLSKTDWTPMTQAVMANGSGVSLGSTGASLKHLLEAGLVIKSPEGAYRLA